MHRKIGAQKYFSYAYSITSSLEEPKKIEKTICKILRILLLKLSLNTNVGFRIEKKERKKECYLKGLIKRITFFFGKSFFFVSLCSYQPVKVA